jgi:hypothetical protein
VSEIRPVGRSFILPDRGEKWGSTFKSGQSINAAVGSRMSERQRKLQHLNRLERSWPNIAGEFPVARQKLSTRANGDCCDFLCDTIQNFDGLPWLFEVAVEAMGFGHRFTASQPGRTEASITESLKWPQKADFTTRSEIAKLFNAGVQKLGMPCQSWGMEKLRVKANLIDSKNSGRTSAFF